jgi:hypothetical protein
MAAVLNVCYAGPHELGRNGLLRWWQSKADEPKDRI